MHKSLKKLVMKVLLLLSLFLFLAYTLQLFDIFKDEVLTKYNVHWRIRIAKNASIDFYGAIIPTIWSVILTFYLIYFRNYPLRRYFSYFFFVVSINLILSTITSTAVVVYYKAFGLVVGFLAVPLT